MSIPPSLWSPRLSIGFFLLLILLLISVPVFAADQQVTSPEPAVYLNFDEGSGNSALDGSGHGNAATLYNVSRTEGGGCNRALLLTNPDGYVAIPYRVLNHPAREITVSAWFFVDNFTPAALVSGYHDGGYRLGFDDGNDLWWTVNLGPGGDVSVPVQHENIAPGQWHHVTGTYDGKTTKIYLDGVLRNQANASGTIHYNDENYIILGADAGAGETPAACTRHFTGGLDEVRIYPVALSYSQVMDDRFRCTESEKVPPAFIPAGSTQPACEQVSGSLALAMNGTAERVLSFTDRTVNGTWQVSTLPGSMLTVSAFDFYAGTYPDAWYLEIDDGHGKPARTIAFAGRNNAPAELVLPSGNATVTVRYFSGAGQFPARVLIRMENQQLEAPRPAVPKNILENPIIVIYSASWATLVAILLVMIWLRWRRKARIADTGVPEPAGCEEKKL